MSIPFCEIYYTLSNGKTDYEIIKKELLLFEDSFEIQYVTDNELEVDNAKIVIYKGGSVK